MSGGADQNRPLPSVGRQDIADQDGDDGEQGPVEPAQVCRVGVVGCCWLRHPSGWQSNGYVAGSLAGFPG